MIAHCLFEQSGTFKNEFKKLGIQAYDYDILNDFGETDYQIDIFEEIEKAWGGYQSIFDNFSKEDIVMAFFPCTRFEEQIILFFRGDSFQQKNTPLKEKLEKCIELHNELHLFYSLISKLVIVALEKNLKLVIENPYGEQHYLKRYWCVKPSLVDKDRSKNGDYYKKPTQYWFINTECKQNIVFEALEYVERKTISKQSGKNRQRERSMIHPQYASRFIRQYILSPKQLKKFYHRHCKNESRELRNRKEN